MGKWPTKDSGFLAEAPGEKWSAIGTALIAGLRGLPGGSSLAKFLEEKRGARNQLNLPALTHGQILQWAADTDKDRTGDWPNRTSGAIPETPGETWANIYSALRLGLRGLPGNLSLTQLLAERRGVLMRGPA